MVTKLYWMGVFVLSILGICALGVGCNSAFNDSIQLKIDQVSKENLRFHVETLSGIGSRFEDGKFVNGRYGCEKFHPEAQAKKVSYIKGKLSDYGYDVELQIREIKNYEIDCITIVATKTGNKNPQKVVELGAHYDTIDNPGADDNCSGVSGVLEVARLLADEQINNTVRFCLYDWEEVGFFGSRYHVSQIDTSKEDFQGAFIFEMIGYSSDEAGSQKAPLRIPLLCSLPSEGNFIAVVGNMSSGYLGNWYENAIDKYVPELRYFSANRIGGFFADAARSDHASYWNRDLPAIMLTDTANFRNPNYHRKTDTVDTLNFDFMQNVVKAMLATLLGYGY